MASSAYVTFLAIALASIGAVLLGGLAYEDFKEREQISRAKIAICGVVLVFLGFLIEAISYVYQVDKWGAVAIILVIAILSGLLGWLVLLIWSRLIGS